MQAECVDGGAEKVVIEFCGAGAAVGTVFVDQAVEEWSGEFGLVGQASG